MIRIATAVTIAFTLGATVVIGNGGTRPSGRSIAPPITDFARVGQPISNTQTDR